MNNRKQEVTFVAKAIEHSTNISIDIKVKQSTFPAGERYLKIEEESINVLNNMKDPHINVTPLSASSDSIMDIVLFSNALNETFPDKIIKKLLIIDYLPYGRQDRACSIGESFSLKVYLNMIAPYYDLISILDVHNKRNTQNIINANPNLQGKIIFADASYRSVDYINVLNNNTFDSFDKETSCIVVVDDGALDRCELAMDFLDISNYIRFTKERVAGTVISRYHSSNIEDFSKITDFIIFDDLIDGGATFLKAASKLDEHSETASKTLVISHGIFSAGLESLKASYNNIFVLKTNYNVNRLNNM